MQRSGYVGIIGVVIASAGFFAPLAAAIVPEAGPSDLAAKEFAAPELALGSANVPLAEVRSQLPNRAAWDAFAPGGPPFSVFVDPRSGAATNLLESVPLLPGTGVRNRVTLADVGRRLGRAVPSVDAAVVADAVLAHVHDRAALLGIDAAQLGPVRATAVNPELWQASIPQRFRGVPVRYGRLVATISHGNLVLLGAETWGDVALPSVEPAIGAAAALEAGFAHAGGRSGGDEVLGAPALEIVPVAPPEHQEGGRFAGPVGRGYAHRLVWTFTFRRPPSPSRWEVMVDAQGGAVLAMQDLNHYAARPIVGGVYPLTSSEACPYPMWCGLMEGRWPMPFADTGQPAPNAFANSAGVYNYLGGAAATHLDGRYVRVNDGCNPLVPIEQGAVNGAIDLGGTNGDHDCDGASAGGGDSAAARTTYYEANRIAEIARGYLPTNDFARGRLSARTNRDVGVAACNAFWDGTAVSFRASGDGCRNAGEIASIVDHEWGHGLDDNDANGSVSNPSEAYADIAAVFRTRDSCVGRGFFESRDFGCGTSLDGGGFNVDEAQLGGSHCTSFCSGVREADFVRHVDREPDTPANHVCARCSGGNGPCGREAHCASAPALQAAWDVARNLSLDRDTGFLWASRLFYQGSGNIGSWYTCGCGVANPSNGCAAGNAYMQWLATDDDNGSLGDGTPHMRGIFWAFDLHDIACDAPVPHDTSCPVDLTRPTLTVTPGVLRNTLNWTKSLAAPRYQVFRSDGFGGCDLGKAKIAEVDALSFVDTNVATGRTYAYSVMAVGAQSTCFSPASNCELARPVGAFTLECTPQSVTPGPAAATCTVQATGGFMSPVSLRCVGMPSGVASCSFDPPTVTPFPGEPASSTLRIQIGPFTEPGTYSFQVRGITPPNVSGPTTPPLTLTVGPAAGGDLFATFDPELRVPACGPLVGRSCDSRTLVVGRAQLGPEPNQPNAIGDCPDGTAGLGSNDRIRVATTDGAPFAAGRKVVVSATVEARAAFADDAADVFFAADAEHPVWQLAGTVVPTGPGPQTLEAAYKLPAGARQAVRVQLRSGGSATACAPGPQDDRDDLVFAVAP